MTPAQIGESTDTIVARATPAGRGGVAVVRISGPTARLSEGLLDELGRLVRDEASTLSIRIGYDDLKRGAA